MGIKCEVDGCRGWARKVPDPDGVRRCAGHSIHPDQLAIKARQAEAGRSAPQKRSAKDRARAAARAKARAAPIPPMLTARAGEPVPPLEPEVVQHNGRPPPPREDPDRPPPPPKPPRKFRSRDDVLTYIEDLATTAEQGGYTPQELMAMTGLAKAASTALGLEAPPDPKKRVTGFRLHVVEAKQIGTAPAEPSAPAKDGPEGKVLGAS